MTINKLSLSGLLASLIALSVTAATPEPTKGTTEIPTPRTRDGRPDLSGNWFGRTGNQVILAFPSKPQSDGSFNIGLRGAHPDSANARNGANAAPPAPPVGVPPGAEVGQRWPGWDKNQPAYKTPELVKQSFDLYTAGAKTDKLVVCGQPGLPRIGAPRKIIQTDKEVIFLYADIAGMVWRVIPIDGRSFRPRVDPSYYGDSVGHWEKDTLVVEARNFVDDTWFGEYGYFHSDQMRVIERLSRKGDTLTYQATVEDPGVLSKPWVKAPLEMTYQKEEIEEPFGCVPVPHDGGHHVQRVP